MPQLSAHFHSDEFRGPVHPELVRSLERLRTLRQGKPLKIISGYRTTVHNREIGGAKRSQHLYGRAADIPYGYATLQEARDAGFRGIGTKGRFAIHVDVRTGPAAHWTY